MLGDITYIRTAELPDIGLWLQDDDGELIDFSSGYTFEFKIGFLGEDAVVTKDTGITGAAGSGTDEDGTPNVTVSFSDGDLDAVEAVTYTWQVRATSGGKDRIFQGRITFSDVVN